MRTRVRRRAVPLYHTTMKLRLRDYLKVAFNARPIGMFVPPNWIGVAAFGLLGLVNPGFWLLGAGLELGYLYTLLSNQRFRRFVEGQKLSEARLEQMAQQRSQLIQLESGDRERYQALEGRCRRILQQQRLVSPSELQTQAEGLDRLLWIYLRLLLTKQSLQRVLRESYRSDGNGLTLEERAAVWKSSCATSHSTPSSAAASPGSWRSCTSASRSRRKRGRNWSSSRRSSPASRSRSS